MIAAVGSVLLTPWNWYNNDDAIHYTLGILGALIGPQFGILIAGFYVGSRQRIWVDDLFTMDTTRRYWFKNGYNPNAVAATMIGGLPAIASVVPAQTVRRPRSHLRNLQRLSHRQLQLVPRLRTRLPRLHHPRKTTPQNHPPRHRPRHRRQRRREVTDAGRQEGLAITETLWYS